jgi:hypothetical protein
LIPGNGCDPACEFTQNGSQGIVEPLARTDPSRTPTSAKNQAPRLYPHQSDLLTEIDGALAAGRRRIMAQAPTGFGKTVIATSIASRIYNGGKPRQKAEPKAREALPKKCPKCSYLKAPKLLICPACGFKPEPKCKVVHADGALVEFSSRSIPKPPNTTERVEFYRQLKYFAVARGYKSGWIAHKYREKFGHWPSGLDYLGPMPPSPTTLGWIKSRQIAFAKGHRFGAGGAS